MKKYLILFNISWSSFLQYRTNLLLSMAGTAIFYAATAILWINIYSGKTLIGSYTQNEMITYVLINGLLSIYIFYSNIRYIIDTWITKGFLSYWIAKPINIPFLWFFEDISRRSFNFLLSVIPFLLIFFIFSNYLLPPVSFGNFILFIFIFMLAGIINYLIYCMVGICAFWVERTFGLVQLVNIMITIAGGSLVPLSLFPGLIGKIFLSLPFKYLFYVPMQVYLGKFNQLQISTALISEIIWILVLYFMARYLWLKGVKKYSAMGG